MSGRPLQSLRLRQATVTILRANADLIAAGDPALDDRIYGRRTPAELTWPFLRVNLTDEIPLRLGSQLRVTVHSFSKAQFDDECETINGAIQSALENAVLDLSAARKAFMTWIGSRVLSDPAEADAWHGVNDFMATIG